MALSALRVASRSGRGRQGETDVHRDLRLVLHQVEELAAERLGLDAQRRQPRLDGLLEHLRQGYVRHVQVAHVVARQVRVARQILGLDAKRVL